MNWRQHKGKFAASTAILSLVFILLLLPNHPSFTLTFLSAPSDAIAGRLGLFELVNHSSETAIYSYSFYKPANQRGFVRKKGNWGVDIIDLDGERQIDPGSRKVLRLLLPVPTNGGPYKLVMQCAPINKTTPQFYRGTRARIVRFISRWLRPPFDLQCRLLGRVFVESPPFEPLGSPTAPNTSPNQHPQPAPR